MPRGSRYDFRLEKLGSRIARSFACPIWIGVVVLVLLYVFGFVLLARFFHLFRSLDSQEKALQSWDGWSGVDYLFTFGDSYTTTSFDIDGTQPVAGNPLGNKEGYTPYGTQVGSPNYVEYLTTKYNQSLVLTYNFGYPGGTIDNQINEFPFGSHSLRYQVEREFMPNFGNTQPYRSWTAKNSLFVAFIGINDVAIFNSKPNVSDYITASLDSYSVAINQLYDAGARNFLFINVPAVDRAPEQNPADGSKGPAAQRLASCIKQFNMGLQQFTKRFRAKHVDLSVFFLDANVLTNRVLDSPKSYETTSVIKNTTAYCMAYKHSPKTDLFVPSCGIPRNEYFWADWLHPTSTVHDLIASQIVNEVLADSP